MIKCAVITGGHHFDVIGFHTLFRELPGIDAYLQHMTDFITSPLDNRTAYDVLVFYTHLKEELPNLGAAPGQDTGIQGILESLANHAQGIVMLHHSLLAFPNLSIWNDLIGIPDRTLEHYQHDEAIQVQIADPNHPITAELNDWTIMDETYLMAEALAENGNHILLTTQHSRNAKTLAWTRQYRSSRICCLQLGHDVQAWTNTDFRQLLTQAVKWCARHD